MSEETYDQQGTVGEGHQNDFKPYGFVWMRNPDGQTFSQRTYKKGNITTESERTHNEFWTAGTPVEWVSKKLERTIRATTAEVGDCQEMLVSRDQADRNTITGYHPLITCFNEILFRFLKVDGHRRLLSRLEVEGDVTAKEARENAIVVWNYLNENFLQCENDLSDTPVNASR